MNNKVLIPFAIAPMLLASCKTHSFVGRYSFMMGKANDSHIGIVLELTDKDYEADPTLGKVFSLSLDSDVAMKGGTSSLLRHDLNRDPEGSSSEETSSEESSSESSSESPIDSLFGGGDFSLSGYYTIGEDKNKDGNYPLNLGARLLDPEEFGSKIVIPDEIVGDIVVAEINKTSIQATIPVSVTDLIYQLYWYGWDISIDIEADVEMILNLTSK